MQKPKAPSDILAFLGALAGHPMPATLVSPGNGACAGHSCERRGSQSLLQVCGAGQEQLPTHIWEEEESEGSQRVLTNKLGDSG